MDEQQKKEMANKERLLFLQGYLQGLYALSDFGVKEIMASVFKMVYGHDIEKVTPSKEVLNEHDPA